MFGQPTGFGGFGQTQPQAPSPFGATPAANPFGATTFGQPQQAPAFGAGGSLFGQASAPAFGAATASAFGAAAPAFGGQQQPRPTFGASFGAAPTFGASQPAFGASAAPAFGMQQSQGAFGVSNAPTFGASSPAFGAASAPAFGAAAAPAFGAPNPFGGSTFGTTGQAFGAAASAPAFGMSGAPAFGAASAPSAFGGGSSIFGATTSSPGAFGAQQPAQQGGLMFGAAGTSTFGMQQPQQPSTGTRMHAYQKTVEKESSAAGASGVANYITLTAMPAYINKSQEELRWEDYQQGVKSAAAGPPQQQAGGGLFGTGAPPFGTPQAAAPTAGFGTGAFGGAAPGAFGVTQSAPAFGSPGSAPAFGAPATSTFGFGAAASPPAFGTAAPTAGFFGSSTAAFGQSQAGSIFGSAPAFASSTPSMFGTPGATSFGAPAASSASMFSFNTAPTMFTPSQAAAAPAQPSMFGSTQPNPFGTSMPAFSAAAPTSSLFPSSSPGFGANAFAPKPSTFAFSSAPAANPSFASFAFSSAANSSPGLFGTMTSPAFAPATAAAPGGFSFASSPGLFNSAVPGFGQVMAATAMAQAQGPPPSVGQAPYGSFPALPAMSEPKVGISARPVNKNGGGGGLGGGGGGALRNSPLLSMRSANATPRFGVQVRSTGASPLALISASPAPSAVTTSADVAPSALQAGNGGAPNGSLLPARANPHRLFIREPPPGTQSATTSSPVLTPLLSPSGAERVATPDRGTNGSDYSNHRGHDGNGPARASPPAADPSADAVLPRLGRLKSEGYSYEPSAVQLQAMHATDPDSLKAVSGFTVKRQGFGQVRWLRPVDVTGLALQRIVTINEGEVFCYTDEEKPPVGQGLNTDAEITLYNVYKLDSRTKQPIREGPAVLKWEKALRSMCATLGAKFVMYKADGGVWKFEVEHFSRYGLLDIDEDDEDEEEAAAAAADLAAGRKLPAVRYGLPGQEAGDVDSPEAQESQGMSGDENDGWLTVGTEEPRDEAVGYMEEEQEEEYVLGAVVRMRGFGGPAAPTQAAAPLQHSLPAQLNLDPSGLMAMHGSLFAERSEAGLAAEAAPGPMAGAAGRSTAQHPWRRRAPSPLTSSSAGTRALLHKEPASPAVSAMTAAASPTPALALRLTDRPGPSPASGFRGPGSSSSSSAAASACFVDAGLCLGPSFRVGWGPGGKLVYPGNLPQGHVVHSRRVLVEGWASEERASAAAHSPGAQAAAGPRGAPEGPHAALRQQLRTALEVHLRHSSPEVPALSLDGPAGGAALALALAAPGAADEEGGAGGEATATPAVPQWSLLCDRRGLPRLVDAYLAGPDSDVAQLQAQGLSEASGAAVEPLLLRRHEAETWRLVQALWEFIEGEDDAGAEGVDEEMLGSSSLGSLDLGGGGQAVLAAFRRRAGLARWLRRQAKGLVEAELGAVAEPAEAVLRLAAAGQTAAAAAIAVAAGDVRLATLLAQSGNGCRQELRAEVSEQLSVWERSDMLGYVARDRLLVYRLLAGQVDGVRDRLQLDWRRYLSLFLGYAVPPAASPARAVELYRHALQADRTAPRPAPLYADERGSLGQCRPRDTHSPTATDLHYELLCLWASCPQPSAQQVEPPGAEVLSALLQAGAYSPNPLDAGLAWHLMTTLTAIGALPPLAAAAVAEEPALQQQRTAALLAVHLNLVTQLTLVGDMGEWAVYVALHVPEPPTWPGLRAHLVEELLTQYCPEWLGHEAKTRFLTESLCLPQALLSKAEAVWARYQGDDVRQCRALLASGAWRPAHQLLVSAVAPLLFLGGREQELRELLAELAPPAGPVCAGVAAPPRVSGPEWDAGGGLYLGFLALFGGVGSAGGVAGSEEEVREVLVRLQAAAEKLAGGGSAAAGTGFDVEAARQQQLRQQLVLSRMAQRLHQVVMGGAPAAATAGAVARKLGDMRGLLGLHDSCLPSDLMLPGIATAATAVTAAAATAVLI